MAPSDSRKNKSRAVRGLLQKMTFRPSLSARRGDKPPAAAPDGGSVVAAAAARSPSPSTDASSVGTTPLVGTTPSEIPYVLQGPRAYPEELCPRCKESQEVVRAGTIKTFRMKYRELIETNCEVCSIIYRGVQAMGHPVLDPAANLSLIVREAIYIHGEADGNTPSLSLICPPALPCPFGIFPSNDDTHGPSIMKAPRTVLSWVRKCVANHKCGNTGNDRQLPTRLLDINPDDGVPIKLVETKGAVGRYVCLSHCWGMHQPLKTTTDNLRQHLEGVPWEKVPTTYRDAITLTGLLGLRYIWIDSLCIVQDDEDDWNRESAAMMDVFQNCFLTIAATSAVDSESGFWHPSNLPEKRITGMTASGQVYEVAARENYRHPHTLFQTGSRDWPLLRRGWVLQELLLSPRVVHMSHPELMWECLEDAFCECSSNLARFAKSGHHAALESGSFEALKRRWQSVAEVYSGLDLSFPTDRLPALSGLAKQMAHKRPDSEYIAGLWKDTLEEDLLWINTEDFFSSSSARRRKAKPRYWTAPSWSWAASDGAVVYPFGLYFYGAKDTKGLGDVIKVWCKVLGAECTATTSDPTGEIASGSLILEGEMLPAILKPDARDHSQFEVRVPGGNDSVQSAKVYVDEPRAPLGMTPQDVTDTRERSWLHSSYNVWLVRMALVRRYRSSMVKLLELEYNLILHCVDEKSQRYRRVGMLVQERESTSGIGEIGEIGEGMPPRGYDPWGEEPSCFDGVQDRRAVTIE